LILFNAWRLVRDAGHILLEGAPAGVETAAIGPALVQEVPGVSEVHHVHVWAITPQRKAATLHACIPEGGDGVEAVRAIKAVLAERFGIAHATVEIEHGVCADRDPHDCGRAADHGHARSDREHRHDHAHAGHAHMIGHAV
jgi:cobalt-zinc-cadmium efflux system protein